MGKGAIVLEIKFNTMYLAVYTPGIGERLNISVEHKGCRF